MRRGSIEHIARAVIKKGNSILLAHQIGEPNTFLPGGHIEYGEFSCTALQRELREELGVEAEIGELIGVLEYQFIDDDGSHHHEINLIFKVEINENFSSRESHLEFLWCSVDQLAERMLLPDPLPVLIAEYIETGERFHCMEKEEKGDTSHH